MSIAEDLGIKIHGVLNTPPKEIEENVYKNIRLGITQVKEHIATKERDIIPIAVVGGGPSLHKEIDQLKQLVKEGTKVVALANSAKTLKDLDIKVNAQVLMDARPNNVNFISEANHYFIASQCPTEVFKKVENAYIWHCCSTVNEPGILNEFYGEKGWFAVNGGPYLMLRTFPLLHILGYRKFHVFGFDSCLIDGEHHAYSQPNEFKTINFSLEGKDFICQAWMINQMIEFLEMVKAVGKEWEMKVYGNGMISHLIEKLGEK